MNIVKINGTTEEQMFQYAFYIALRHYGCDAAIFAPSFRLAETFAITSPSFVTARDIPVSHSMLDRLKRGLTGGKTDNDGMAVVRDSHHFNRENLSKQNCYFDGEWQSCEYFSAIADKIISEFSFLEPLNAKLQHIAQEMQEGESVAIHIAHPTSSHCTCTHDYYNWAIAHIKMFIPDGRVFIFTDNVKWARQNLMLDDEAKIYSTSHIHDVELMQLMSIASHNIISNTLTAFWAAFLNKNPDKIVIAPQVWNKKHLTDSLLPSFWITIPVT